MYTITKGPSKLATQRRTGPTAQQVEIKLADLKCRRREQQQQQQQQQPHQQQTPPPQTPNSWSFASSAPRLVFNRVSGKKAPLISQPTPAAEESYTVAHEENVKFVYEAWQQVEQELDGNREGDGKSGPVRYAEKTELKDFVAIDLEDWWAQQFLAKLENGS